MIPWRTLAGGLLGAALAVAVAIWLAWPGTVLESALWGGGLPVAGLIAGGVLDIRADRRRDTARGTRR